MAPLDLEDSFINILIQKYCKRLLWLSCNRKAYQFRLLSFGLSLSPRNFKKVLGPVLSCERTKGIKISAYLDDLIIIALGTRIKDKIGKISNSTFSYHKASKNGYQFTRDGSQGTPFKDRGLEKRIEKN
ncbi:hypothetical protein AYI68_g5413 [Smittium mucronatum]|uniref:Reverse transcriptase domain-containing protein n=1 Tax=Smittium mucronatum TaxID=133383 RepID=A0A1R0GUE3_9FUNG|nr:hypothetical protein AYI68_g5413 [Smittium mucronatum]